MGSMKKVLLLCCAGVMVLGGVAAARGRDEPVVLLQHPPDFVGVHVSGGVHIWDDREGLNAYDMDTGELRWTHHYSSPPRRFSPVVESGQRNLLLWDEDVLTVLDKVSGAQRWQCSDVTHGKVTHMRFLPGSDWVEIRYTREAAGKPDETVTVLYAPDKSEHYVVPENWQLQRWMPDKERIITIAHRETDAEPYRVGVWAPARDAHEEVFVSEAVDFVGGVLSTGELLLCNNLHSDGERQFKAYRLPLTAGSPRERIASPAKITTLPFTIEGGAYIVMARTEAVWVLDATDGAVKRELKRPGHTFLPVSVTHDDAGAAWIVSCDTAANAWLWPLTTADTPRQFFDGMPFLSGEILEVRPPHVIIRKQLEQEGHANVVARHLDTGKQVASWTIPWEGVPFSTRFCNAFQRCLVVHYRREESAGGGHYIRPTGFAIFESEQEMAVFESEETWVSEGFSPDGRYVVSRDNATPVYISVTHVDSARVVAYLPSGNRWGRAVFSPDGKLLALWHDDTITIIAMEEHYPQRTLAKATSDRPVTPRAFSRDGKLLMCAGRGEARVIDVQTRAQLGRMQEPERFRRRISRPHEVFGVTIPFLHVAEDYAARHIRHLRNEPWLQPFFIGEGVRAGTVANERLIRVWDTHTGQLLHTMAPEISERRDDWGQMRHRVVLSDNGAFALFYNPLDYEPPTLWDVNTGHLVRKFDISMRGYDPVAVADNGAGFYLTDRKGLYFLPVSR